MDAPVLYSGGGFEVSTKLLKTPRKSYAIPQLEYVEVRRPFLAFVGLPAVGVIGFCFAFWRYLYGGEIVTLTGVSGAALLVAFLFGTLRVHSLALRDDEVAMSFGLVSRLREVRAAVEQAMAARQDGKDA